MRGPAWPFWARQEGFALPLTLFALTFLALLTAAFAGMTTSELQAGRLAEWDRRSLYVAEAGIEHQIFVLKANRNAGPVGTVDLGGSPLRAQYVVDRWPASAAGVCTGQVSGNETRWWEIMSRGELWRGAELVHQRSIWAVVEIRYRADKPVKVTVCRWRSG